MVECKKVTDEQIREAKELSTYKTFNNIEEVKTEEKKLKFLMKACTNKSQKLKYYKLALNLYEERKRLVGLRIDEKIELKIFKRLVAKFEKKLNKSLNK